MKPTEQASEGILWAKYLHALMQEGIPEERIRYYTGWVESFRRFQKSRSPEVWGRRKRRTSPCSLGASENPTLAGTSSGPCVESVLPWGPRGGMVRPLGDTGNPPGIKRASHRLRTHPSSLRVFCDILRIGSSYSGLRSGIRLRPGRMAGAPEVRDADGKLTPSAPSGLTRMDPALPFVLFRARLQARRGKRADFLEHLAMAREVAAATQGKPSTRWYSSSGTCCNSLSDDR
jgi:hypothetical protein